MTWAELEQDLLEAAGKLAKEYDSKEWQVSKELMQLTTAASIAHQNAK